MKWIKASEKRPPNETRVAAKATGGEKLDKVTLCLGVWHEDSQTMDVGSGSVTLTYGVHTLHKIEWLDEQPSFQSGVEDAAREYRESNGEDDYGDDAAASIIHKRFEHYFLAGAQWQSSRPSAIEEVDDDVLREVFRLITYSSNPDWLINQFKEKYYLKRK